MADTAFSQAEQKLLVAMLINVKGTIDTDWDKVAQCCGHKDKGVSKANWHRLRIKKITPQQSEGDTSTGKKRATDEGQEDDDAVAGGEEVTKQKGKGGRRPAKKAAKTKVKDEQQDEHDGDAA